MTKRHESAEIERSGGAQVKDSRESTSAPAKTFTEEAFSRVAEARLVGGNRVRLLKDARENYPAWLAAIARAEKYIHFESYIIHEDRQGEIFADALIKKAKEGVRVRLIYDWLGGFGKTSRRFWRDLRAGGVEVRCYNPFSFARPLAWISRDHRKIIDVDGKIAFVTGLCVGEMWAGDTEKKIEPWRDTGIELRGAAVAEVGRAFADIWDDLGAPLPKNEFAAHKSGTAAKDSSADAGAVNLRVVATKPGNARIYRLDQMIGALASETLWLTDAYFAGTPAYLETLRAAAADGVDVRLLVPAATDIAVMSTISRAGYRGLLEAGVKIYEWDGPMLHAKTAVIDGFWSRVGSTNLNVASWLTNCEIDVLVEDREFGRAMQEMYLADLENATEICLNEKSRPVKTSRKVSGRGSANRTSSGSTARFAPSVIAVGSALGSSVAKIKRRPLGTLEAKISLTGGVLLLITGAAALFYPRVLAVPLGIIFVWLAVSLLINSFQLYRAGRKSENRSQSPKKSPK